MSTDVAIPPAFTHLVDDAAIFPPGLAPLDEAVDMHVRHRRSNHRDFVGTFVIGRAQLEKTVLLARSANDGSPIGLSVVCERPDDIEAAVTIVRGSADVILRGLEVKLPEPAPLVDQLRQAIGTLIELGPMLDGVVGYIEVPRPSHSEWPELLDTVADAGLRLKFRTGGTVATAFPDSTEVAQWIVDAVRADVPFKCTAGRHRAVRHHDPATGFEHHGYLNILAATLAATSGAGYPEVVELLELRAPDELAALVTRSSADELLRARGHFVAYGSCSIDEPLHDLTDLQLIPAIAQERSAR